MDGFDIGSFKSKFGSGARSYLFLWHPEFPFEEDVLGENAKYLVRSSSMPGDTVEEITVNWQGADLRMPGKRTFEDWSITLNLDYDADLRQELEKWMGLIHDVDDTGEYGEYDDFRSTQRMRMLDYDGSKICEVVLYDAWLKSIGEVSLDYSAQDTAQVEITFTYLYHEIEE